MVGEYHAYRMWIVASKAVQGVVLIDIKHMRFSMGQGCSRLLDVNWGISPLVLMKLRYQCDSQALSGYVWVII